MKQVQGGNAVGADSRRISHISADFPTPVGNKSAASTHSLGLDPFNQNRGAGVGGFLKGARLPLQMKLRTASMIVLLRLAVVAGHPYLLRQFRVVRGNSPSFCAFAKIRARVRERAAKHYPPWTARLARRAEDAEEVLAPVSPQTKFSTCWTIRSCCTYASPGYMGNERASAAAPSDTGKSPFL